MTRVTRIKCYKTICALELTVCDKSCNFFVKESCICRSVAVKWRAGLIILEYRKVFNVFVNERKMSFWAHTVVWKRYNFLTMRLSLSPKVRTHFFYKIENSSAIPASKVILFWAHKVRKARQQIKYN
jgi:hypothetical protein